MARNYEWRLHDGFKSPVPENTVVAYRTSYTDREGSHVSHIHVPVQAKHINWADAKGFGRIYKYAIVG